MGTVPAPRVEIILQQLTRTRSLSLPNWLKVLCKRAEHFIYSAVADAQIRTWSSRGMKDEWKVGHMERLQSQSLFESRTSEPLSTLKGFRVAAPRR
jgi:hypothetical protein